MARKARRRRKTDRLTKKGRARVLPTGGLPVFSRKNRGLTTY